LKAKSLYSPISNEEKSFEFSKVFLGVCNLIGKVSNIPVILIRILAFSLLITEPKLAIALQVLAPFLGLSLAAEKGYSATPFFSLLFIAVVVIIRWHKIQKSVFELLGVQ